MDDKYNYEQLVYNVLEALSQNEKMEPKIKDTIVDLLCFFKKNSMVEEGLEILEHEDGLLNYLYELIEYDSHHQDEHLLKYFCQKIDPFLFIANCKPPIEHRLSLINENNSGKYVLNIYAMLKIFHTYKDSGENESFHPEIKKLWNMCSAVSSEYEIGPDDYDNIRSYIDWMFGTTVRIAHISGIENLIRCILTNHFDVKIIHQSILAFNLLLAIVKKEDILDDIGDLNIMKALVSLEKSRKIERYDIYFPTLLSNERFDFFPDLMEKRFFSGNIAEDETILLQVLDRIAKIDCGFFDMGKELERDAFIDWMTIIFDSDTLYEMNSRLKALGQCYEKYKMGEKLSYDMVTSNIKDEKHKEVRDGIVVSYDSFQALMEKPDNIVERTSTLYSYLFDYSTNFTYFCRTYYGETSIEAIYSKFNDLVKDSQVFADDVVPAIDDGQSVVEENNDLDVSHQSSRKKIKKLFTKK